MIESRITTSERASLAPYLIAWLVACAILVAANLGAIRTLTFHDPDDTLRLIQVRDWLAGQSWFDVHQYRMNAPEGAPMHWSRLVDLPIAALILLLRPLLGPAGAETAALIIVPLLTLGVVMMLVAKVTRRLLDHDHAVLAAFLVPVPVALAQQLKPMRIDHHGWQMALAMAALLAALHPDRRRAGFAAGAAAATWLAISLEGLPFAAALLALFAIRWVIDPREGARLVTAAVGLALTSLLLFALTKDGAGWAANFCDAVSPAHLGALTIAAAGCAALVRLPIEGWAAKLGGLAAVGLAAGATLLAAAPHCAAGPFEQLDPLVYNFWYLNVAEGLPFWRQDPLIALTNFSFPVLGMIGCVIKLRGARGQQRSAWLVTLFLLASAFLTALFVQRASSAANLFALPGGVALARMLLLRARAVEFLPSRVALMLAAVAVIAPGHLLAFAAMGASGEARANAKARPAECLSTREMGGLDRLPPSDFATPLDIGPAILLRTRHRIIASGHHRNSAAMHDAISIFISAPERARALMAKRSIDYVAICPGLPEPDHYARQGPDGLWSQLKAGRTPEWLEPVALPGVRDLRVWRVKG